MDKTVPAPAARLLDFIGDIEAPRGYDTIYGNNQSKLLRPITQMTIAELQALQPSFTSRYGSSASGRYQFMRETLAGLRKELGLRDNQLFDADLQDRLAYHLLKRRGYEAFMARTITLEEFAKRLAQEWASLPVLAPTQRQTKTGIVQIKRGQSYYAGDGMNKSLVQPQWVEEMLCSLHPVRDSPKPVPPPPMTPSTTSMTAGAIWGVLGTMIAAGLTALAIWFHS